MPKRPPATAGKRAPGKADTLPVKKSRHSLLQSKKLGLDQAGGSSRPELDGLSRSFASPTRQSHDASSSELESKELDVPEARELEHKELAVEPLHVPEQKEASTNTPVLTWMRVPIEIGAGGGLALSFVKGIDPRLMEALHKCGYKELFPVQAAAWKALAGGMSSAHDLCICAPTGSGKTLAYALPILQGLLGQPRRQLGAVLVLPTRELAVQVYNVFASLCPAVGLWVGLAAARLSLPAEVKALSSVMVNILVATPGRLMAHLKAPEPTFVLHHLRFLVVDETDRLLRQSYQEWLPFMVAATRPQGGWRRGLSGRVEVAESPVVKVIVSATLTQNPAKIDRLGLHAPRYIAMSAADHRYKVPKQLKEFKLVGAAPDKPLLLMALLQHLRPARILIFTASLQATHRLFVLLSQVSSLAGEVAEYFSSAGGRSFKTGLASFRAGIVRVLVASDAMTRGMDVQGIQTVINYDPPVYAKTYVHRAGRTARAGKEGQVITLLRAEEVRHFKGMLRKVDNSFVKDFLLPINLASSLRPVFQEALERASAAVEERTELTYGSEGAKKG